jgi:NAD(P)-dependent dehydrogenase (short-subunit alcohol dehydrogenase family)
MTQPIRFDDRVVIVTGAGHGLGRSYATAFAARGAKVVVNDLGATARGDGRDDSVAQRVVDEIRSTGGQAVANGESVEQGARIVEAALDCYGRVDVIINNAGMLRDAAFHKMSEADWELIQRVHVNGAFQVTRAAWPRLRAQGYGRIVMTSSAAGIHGNFGQANYATAKLGLFGLTQTLAIEGGKHEIRVNAIAPVAASRLTQTLLPASVLVALTPQKVTPLVLLLGSQSCPGTGELFEVGGGSIARLRWERSRSVTLGSDQECSPERVLERWRTLQSFAGTDHPVSVADSFEFVRHGLAE